MQSQKNSRIIVLAIVVISTVLLLFILIISAATSQKKITQTGGNYSPISTSVVFKNSNSLYNSARSDDIEEIRTLLADYVSKVSGNGTFYAYILDDKINFAASIDGMPPSYWFDVAFEKLNYRIRVDANLQTGTPQFTIKQI